MRRLISLCLVLSLCGSLPVFANSLDLGFNNTGLSIGNSARWNGVRFNFRDADVIEVNGINLTVFQSKQMTHSTMRGLTLGVIGPQAGSMYGMTIGGVVAGADNDLHGLAIGGLASGAGSDMRGLAIGGLASGAGSDMCGLIIGGLVAGAGNNFTGAGFGGLAFGAGDDLTGIGVGGLAVGAGEHFHGLGLAGLAVGAGDEMRGIGIGGVAVGSPDFKGVALSLGHIKSENFSGLSVSAYNRTTVAGDGLFIGIFNYNAQLHGVQLGLLNYAGNNSGWKKWLPFINMHFD